MEKVSRQTPLDRMQFHARLREWLSGCDEQTIGSANYGGEAWIHVHGGEGLFALNADTRRESVAKYLELVKLHGDNISWKIRLNQRGIENAVSYGPESLRIESFFFYLKAAA